MVFASFTVVGLVHMVVANIVKLSTMNKMHNGH
jgi:hypothetical protein